MKKSKGITLVALVVTIMIMLILAGVSFNAIGGDTGIIAQTQKAKELHIIASEREFLEQEILYYKLREVDEPEIDNLIGRKLSKKDVTNPDWYMIKSGENVYADGWYFVQKGLEVENYGEIASNWLINYEKGELIELKEGEYYSISLGELLGRKYRRLDAKH